MSDFLAAFRDALSVLAPIAQRLKMEWRDEGQHIHWERMAEAVFDSCVRGPIEADARHRRDDHRLPRYDIDDSSYGRSSWIRVERGGDRSLVVFIRLLSGRETFDEVQGAKLDENTFMPLERVVIPFDQCRFAFVRRSAVRSDVVHDIEAVE